MPRQRTWALASILIGLFVCVGTACGKESDNLGQEARKLTQAITDLGPRPSGSDGLEKVRMLLEKESKSRGATLSRDTFTTGSKSPIPGLNMVNLSYTLLGTKSDQRVILVAHYESLRTGDIGFVGANDSASAVALLLVLTPEIQKRKLPFDVEVLFVDGEEALVEWSEEDGVYGSRHYVANHATEKEKIRSVIVLSMISDANLKLIYEPRNDVTLRTMLAEVASEMGKKNLIDTFPLYMTDDHRPFQAAGIPTLLLMDYTYGDANSPGKYWHTRDDTIDHVSTESLSTVGNIVLRMLDRLALR